MARIGLFGRVEPNALALKCEVVIGDHSNFTVTGLEVVLEGVALDRAHCTLTDVAARVQTQLSLRLDLNVLGP